MAKPTRRTYLAPYDIFRQKLGFDSREKSRGEVTNEQVEAAVRVLLRAIPVDETWYRRTYPDVSEAIDAGLFRSARDHFVQNGYFEGRRPHEIEVDEEWYLAHYDDVAEGVETGEIGSASEHFHRHGYREGRLPFDL